MTFEWIQGNGELTSTGRLFQGEAIAILKGKGVGKVRIYKVENRYYGSGLFVQRKFRRRGIATKLYDFVETKLKVKLTPNFTLTDYGLKFWANRRKQEKMKIPRATKTIPVWQLPSALANGWEVYAYSEYSAGVPKMVEIRKKAI